MKISTPNPYGPKRGIGTLGRPAFSQVAKIVALFGGEANLAKLLGTDRMVPYKWQYPRPYGSDGLIPSAKVGAVLRAARREGILITPEDWFPEFIDYEEEKS